MTNRPIDQSQPKGGGGSGIAHDILSNFHPPAGCPPPPYTSTPPHPPLFHKNLPSFNYYKNEKTSTRQQLLRDYITLLLGDRKFSFLNKVTIVTKNNFEIKTT